MVDASFAILLSALVLDWFFGEPDFLWSRLPHPVVLFGKAVSFADNRLNIPTDSDAVQFRKGSLAIALLIVCALVAGLTLQWIVDVISLPGLLLELIIVMVLLAQRSLHDHVCAVATGLRENGLEGGRAAVAMIVGRDPQTLDASGVSRAAIESLAENYSDGVVAPVFWYAIFGLPGIIVYKMVNTADSMIAYKNEKYLWFGRTAAQIDDLVNWVPARLSALLIACAGGVVSGIDRAKQSTLCAFRDSGLHGSPNAGWPEGAMAGALDVALGGPRNYGEEQVVQSHINAGGKHKLGIKEIDEALQVFAIACFVLSAVVLVLVFIG